MAKTAESTVGRELALARRLDAPRERVWDAWADPGKIGLWWGPNGFTTRTSEFALRPGGVWRLVMVGPDGVEYPNLARFDEVRRPERIVYSQSGGRPGSPTARFQATADFRAVGRRTDLSLRMVFETAAAREIAVGVYGAVEGGRQTLARLAELLARGGFQGGEFVFSRSFAAPRERVFRAWTDPALLARWWGPAGFTAPVCEADPRPGGAIRIAMRAPDGAVYPMVGEYREVAPPERLVFVSTALGPEGLPIFEVLHAVLLAEHGGRTELTLRALPFNKTAAAARYLGGMDEGWAQSLRRLSETLA